MCLFSATLILCKLPNIICISNVFEVGSNATGLRVNYFFECCQNTFYVYVAFHLFYGRSLNLKKPKIMIYKW